MRKTPFVSSLNTSSASVESTNETVNQISFDDSVVDLSQRLKSKLPKAEEVVPDDKVDEKVDEGKEESSSSVQGDEKKVEDNEFEDAGFGTFKEMAETKLGEFMDDPEQFTEIMLKFSDLIRSLIYPWLYSKIIFTSQEQIDVEIMLKNRSDAMRKNEEYEFNLLEKELYAKVIKLSEHKAKIPLDEKEIKWLSKILSKRIKDVPMAVWMEKYDWLLALLYIEGKRFLPVGQDRVAKALLNSFTK